MYRKINLDYQSLEPIIDDRTLNLHYNKHYQNYTDSLNKYLGDINYNYELSANNLAKDISILPIEYRNEILYNLGGYLNHSLYFYNLDNKNKEVPLPFLNEINKEFGSFANFKEKFITTALELKGSGYTFLVLDRNNKLKIINMSNQDTPYYYGFKPIMTIDVWEHAYYLKYTYNKKEYLENIFNIIDFNKVYELYKKEIETN